MHDESAFEFPDKLVEKFAFDDLLKELNTLNIPKEAFEVVLKFKHFAYNELKTFSYQEGTRNFYVYADLFVFEKHGGLLKTKEVAIKFNFTQQEVKYWLDLNVLNVFFKYDYVSQTHISTHIDLMTALELCFLNVKYLTFDMKQLYNKPSFNFDEKVVFIGISGATYYIDWKKKVDNIDVSNVIKILE